MADAITIEELQALNKHSDETSVVLDESDKPINETYDDDHNLEAEERSGKQIVFDLKILFPNQSPIYQAEKSVQTPQDQILLDQLEEKFKIVENCSTVFTQKCQITFQPMTADENIEICTEPLKKVCNDTIVGDEVCWTDYEISCETRVKNQTVEQYEPLCKMVLKEKCYTEPTDKTENRELLKPRNESCHRSVQECIIEKKAVIKFKPETVCQRFPREVCATSNCAFVQGERKCHYESRSYVQNIPSEICELEPTETCRLEKVLVPRLKEEPNLDGIQVPNYVQNPNYVQVPNHIQVPNRIQVPNFVQVPNHIQVPNHMQVPNHIQVPTHIQVPKKYPGSKL